MRELELSERLIPPQFRRLKGGIVHLLLTQKTTKLFANIVIHGAARQLHPLNQYIITRGEEVSQLFERTLVLNQSKSTVKLTVSEGFGCTRAKKEASGIGSALSGIGYVQMKCKSIIQGVT